MLYEVLPPFFLNNTIVTKIMYLIAMNGAKNVHFLWVNEGVSYK